MSYLFTPAPAGRTVTSSAIDGRVNDTQRAPPIFQTAPTPEKLMDWSAEQRNIVNTNLEPRLDSHENASRKNILREANTAGCPGGEPCVKNGLPQSAKSLRLAKSEKVEKAERRRQRAIDEPTSSYATSSPLPKKLKIEDMTVGDVIKDLECRLESSDGKVRETASELNELRSKLEETTTERDELRARLEQTADEKQKLAEEKEKIATAHKESRLQVTKLTKDIIELASERRKRMQDQVERSAAWCKERVNFHSEIQRMKAQKTKIQIELENSNTDNEKLRSELQEHQTKANAAKDELCSRLQKSQEEISELVQRHREELSMQQRHSTELKERLRNDEKLRGQLWIVRRKLDLAERDVYRLEDKIDARDCELDWARRQIDTENSRRNDLEVELGRMKFHLDEAYSQRNEERQKVEALAIRLNETRMERDTVLTRKDELEAQRAAIYAAARPGSSGTPTTPYPPKEPYGPEDVNREFKKAPQGDF